jgi:RNA polymerase primary sigma factor
LTAIYNQYIKDVSKYPLLEREEEKRLIKLASQGHRPAMNKLVVSNLKFVINIAFMYKNQGLTINELINEGNLGLMEAARRFDAKQKIKFISYAVWWIRQSITRAIAEKARVVRISAEKELVLRRLNKKSRRLVQTIGGQYVMDYNEISQSTDYTPEQVENILKMGLRHASLDAPVGEDGESNLLEMTPADSKTSDEFAEVK